LFRKSLAIREKGHDFEAIIATSLQKTAEHPKLEAVDRMETREERLRTATQTGSKERSPLSYLLPDEILLPRYSGSEARYVNSLPVV